MPGLGVNIDHLASLRQLRKGRYPRLVDAARIAEKHGADSIVVHLRQDRRHVHDQDLISLRKSVTTLLNMEMSVAQEIVDIACKVKPDRATLVPERRQEVTTEGGLDVVAHFPRVRKVCADLQACGIQVSLFIDPCKKQIDASVRAGVSIIELHTGNYANAGSAAQKKKCLGTLKAMVRYAKAQGLRVCAGHGLEYDNVAAVAQLAGIEELNIGYAIVCRAALEGLGRAVHTMKRLAR